MRIWLLSSGSSGNAAVVEAGGGRILIDAGLGPRAAASRMRRLGGELFPRGVDAIIITHHHGDHIAHLEPLARALRAPVFLHPGVTAEHPRKRLEVRSYAAGEGFRVGPFDVTSSPLPHDAPQVALRFRADALCFGLATDLGHVPDGLSAFLGECDEALVEANYSTAMMRDGPYPERLKRRVTGGAGHLSNDQTAALASSLAGTRLRKVWLGHISRVNNTSALALAAVKGAVSDVEVEVIEHGEPCRIDLRRRDAERPRAGQLALPFA
jgi:phosphoribosyl 1,2-cyclic phosphodiesterase